MGSSLQIVTRDPIEIETTRLFAENNGLTLTTVGTLDDGGAEMRMGLGNEEDGILPLIAVDGPFKIDEEELPALVLSYLLGPQWIMLVSIEEDGPKEAQGVARSYSKFVAEHCRGVVYDPSDESVIWPKATPQKYRAAVVEERISLVTLEWCIPILASPQETVLSFLSLLKKRCVEALPKRFGRTEPYKGKFLLGKEESFVEEWTHCATRESGDVLYWSSSGPCFGGSARFSDQRKKLPETWKPQGAVSRLLISVDFDGRALASDDKLCQIVITLFQDIAHSMNAFYAAGYVRRNALAKKKVILDHESENYQLQSQHWFMGLPPTPTWLAWFGPPYRKFLDDVAPECEERHGGLLLKTNKKPLNLDELKSVFPRLPGELQAVERSKDGYGIQTTEILPALLIPVSDS